jgi:hypothetical protein
VSARNCGQEKLLARQIISGVERRRRAAPAGGPAARAIALRARKRRGGSKGGYLKGRDSGKSAEELALMTGGAQHAFEKRG